ncbi:hypothetical protein EYF80_018966 [Liparis tanakae]|uniref:Uncharacterized protein n=1 Tax=Liparis tanakae TaxID=230148 RepID=A0A4Z2I0S1_9TELE|nr:hypothetical protein EYF80_018966 [Liparis tanakae]
MGESVRLPEAPVKQSTAVALGLEDGREYSLRETDDGGAATRKNLGEGDLSEKEANATRVPSEARCTLNRQHDTPRGGGGYGGGSAARSPLKSRCMIMRELIAQVAKNIIEANGCKCSHYHLMALMSICIAGLH